MSFAPGTITDGVTTIEFDIVRSWPGGRKPSHVAKQGDLDGGAMAESSGASLLDFKVSFEIVSNGFNTGLTAIDMWAIVDEFIRTKNDTTVSLKLRFETANGEKQIDYTGKTLGGWAYDFTIGDPDSMIGTISFTVETVGSVASSWS